MNKPAFCVYESEEEIKFVLCPACAGDLAYAWTGVAQSHERCVICGKQAQDYFPDRRPCPVCGRSMKFIFPTPRQDKDIDALLWRFQECRLGCGVQMDVVTGLRYDIANPRRDHTLQVDRQFYPSLRAWLTAIGVLQ